MNPWAYTQMMSVDFQALLIFFIVLIVAPLTAWGFYHLLSLIKKLFR